MMDYQNALKELKAQVFTETAPQIKKETTGFIPIRNNTQVKTPEDTGKKSVEWLKEIRAASEEIKTRVAKAQKAVVVEEPVVPRKRTIEEDAAPLIARRGDTPSTYSPDRPLTPNSGIINLKNKEEFIAAIYPTAIEVGRQTGVDPRIIVAQAAVESGWGESAPNNNYFGLKSHGKPGGATMATNEVVNGKTVTENASFRRFDSPADSVRGYGEFLMENPRYKSMREAGSLEEQVRALGRSGYATDPSYADKVYSIATGLPPLSDEGDVAFVRPKPNPIIKRREKS